jgi:hypothetical protein
MRAGAIAVLLVSLLLPFAVQAHGGVLDLSVYDRTEGRRLPVYWHQGRAYVVGKPGNEYQVVLRNRLREEALAIVSVDGVNVVTGQTADSRQAGYVLSAGSSYDILGWRKSLAQTAAFYFTALPDSYAARTGRPENVGVIGAAVFRKKREPQAIAPSAAAKEEARIGTGHGRREDSPIRQVTFERATPNPAETVTLYYDSYRNLVAQGVIPRSQPIAPRPQAFPGAVSTFAPDPPG